MTTYQFFTTAWTWNSIVLILSAVAFVGYFVTFGQRGEVCGERIGRELRKSFIRRKFSRP